MPLFDFECQNCHERFEEIVFASTQVRCPKCEVDDVKKLPSRVSIGRGGGASSSSLAPSYPVGGG